MAIVVEHTHSKNSNIWKYQETNISCSHILELYIFTWRVQTVALHCVWRFTYIYLGCLKHGGTGTILHVKYRHWSKFMHSTVPHKVYENTAVTCQSSTCFHLKYSYWVCFLGLWIIDKDTKALCLGPLKHGEIWSIAHKNCIYLSTTIQTQVSYTICHCHIVADNAYQSNLTKNTVLKLPTNKIL